MAAPYDRTLLETVHTISAAEFEDAWMAREKACGRLNRSLLKTMLFAIVGLSFLAMLVPDMIRNNMLEAAWEMMLAVLSACGVIYETMVLPRRLQTQAQRIYHADPRLKGEEKTAYTVSGYQIENQYETIRGYWSETDCCVETGTMFVFCAGGERELVILLKSALGSGEELDAFRDKMKEIFGARYKTGAGAGK